MAKIRASNLTDLALDWAVAKCERAGVTGIDADGHIRIVGNAKYTPSTDWAQGGPIIEREKIDVNNDPNGKKVWQGRCYASGATFRTYGHTPLIAAMRCYVASKLGDEIEVPDELV